MNNEDREARIIRLLRELADYQEGRLPPKEMGEFERRKLLEQLKPVQSKPRPGLTFWELWRSRFKPAFAFAAVAALALLAALVWVAAPWKGAAPQLALRWPATTPFEPSTAKVWRSAQAALPRTLPDFGYSVGTLGGLPDERYTRWQLATVIVQSEAGFGSGAVISPDGWILTTYQVVAEAAQTAAVQGRAAKVKVIMAKLVAGRIQPHEPALPATLYRADPRLDLALLKLDALSEGVSQMPHFKLAGQVKVREECYLIGSQPDGPAWLIRSGNIMRKYDYPELPGSPSIQNGWGGQPARSEQQPAAQIPQNEGAFLGTPANKGDTQNPARLVAGRDGLVARGTPTPKAAPPERFRAAVLVSDVSISAGDAGGPLLNAQGELIGLTIIPPADEHAESDGRHIALEHVREFVANLPAQPEGVPFDPWTAGLPGAILLEPELADGDGDGRIDSLRYCYASATGYGYAKATLQPVAMTVFVDISQHTKPTEDPPARIPTGLWAMEDLGQFKFDLFLLTRADGVTAVGYTNPQGIVDEIRIGRSGVPVAQLLWRRDANGKWQSSTPAAATPLVDTPRLGAKNLLRLQIICQQEPPVAKSRQR